MSGQYDRQPDTEIDGLYYHLITANAHDTERDVSRLARPDVQPEQNPELDYDYHPDDLAELAQWEERTGYNIALWMVLMAVVCVVVVPYAPLFTPLVSVLFGLMSAVFYLRARFITQAQLESLLDWYHQYPVLQWTGGSLTLSLSIMAYFFAVMVPYSAVPASVQTLLFLVAMNFSMYTPIAIIRVIRQRGLRKKWHPKEN